MQQNALRYRGIRYVVTSQMETTKSNTNKERWQQDLLLTRGYSSQSNAGNSSQSYPRELQSNPWKWLADHLRMRDGDQLIMHPTKYFPQPPPFRKWLTIAL